MACRAFFGCIVTLLFLSVSPTSAPGGRAHEISYKDHQGKPGDNSFEKSNIRVWLDPDSQNIPLDPTQKELRPPPPLVPEVYDIFIGLSAFRDGIRCGYTLFTGFTRARNPNRMFFGVVDQVNENDIRCIDAYCELAKKEWPSEECKYKTHIQIDERLADDSRGPTLARHYQQKMVGTQEFCLQLDAHSVFTIDWDLGLVADWKSTGNEMAVLSTYLHNLNTYINADGSNNPPKNLPHICQTMRGGNGLVRNVAAEMIVGSKHPQLSALWGAGLSFGKCHAERRALVDSHTPWMFDGEEFLRMATLWTHGYDVYSPSRVGSVVYHNYSKVANRFEHVKVDQVLKEKEREMGINRFKLKVGWPFKGPVDGTELTKYTWGTTRSLKEFLNYSGITFEAGKSDAHSCKQLHWVPYSDPREIEILLPGWRLHPTTSVAPMTIPITTKQSTTFIVKAHLVGAKKHPNEANIAAGEKLLWKAELILFGLVSLILVGIALRSIARTRHHHE